MAPSALDTTTTTTSSETLANGHTDKAKAPSVKLKYTSTTYPTRSLDFLQPFMGRGLAADAQPSVVPRARLTLDIIIVGAGLGGLATAIALARRGHRVRVFEQAHALAEVRHSRSAVYNALLVLYC